MLRNTSALHCSIVRYHNVGYVTDLAGKTDLEQARADMLADCMNDATRAFVNPGYIMNPDQDAKVIVLIFELVTHCRHSTLFVTDTSLI